MTRCVRVSEFETWLIDCDLFVLFRGLQICSSHRSTYPDDYNRNWLLQSLMDSGSGTTDKTTTSALNRPISDLLTETYPSFDHRARVVAPFDDESKRDAEFVQSDYMLSDMHVCALISVLELNSMLLELILDFHAWSAARPTHESERTADMLEKEVKVLMEAEKEQGRCLSAPIPSSSSSSASRSVVGRRTP